MTYHCESSFIIIKPDGFSNEHFIQEFRNRLTELDLSISNEIEITSLNTDNLKRHYQHLIDKPFYHQIEKYMTSGRVLIAIIRGDNAISKVRTLLGATNPLEAEEHSLRRKYGKVKDGQIFNCCHASDSNESARREIDIWYGKDFIL